MLPANMQILIKIRCSLALFQGLKYEAYITLLRILSVFIAVAVLKYQAAIKFTPMKNHGPRLRFKTIL